MLVVTYNISDVLHSKQFSNDKKGNAELLLFIENLKDSHISNPYFTHLSEIKKLTAKIDNFHRYTMQHATYSTWRSKKSKLQSLRDKFLKDNNIVQPCKLTVSITTI